MIMYACSLYVTLTFVAVCEQCVGLAVLGYASSLV